MTCRKMNLIIYRYCSTPFPRFPLFSVSWFHIPKRNTASQIPLTSPNSHSTLSKYSWRGRVRDIRSWMLDGYPSNAFARWSEQAERHPTNFDTGIPVRCLSDEDSCSRAGHFSLTWLPWMFVWILSPLHIDAFSKFASFVSTQYTRRNGAFWTERIDHRDDDGLLKKRYFRLWGTYNRFIEGSCFTTRGIWDGRDVNWHVLCRQKMDSRPVDRSRWWDTESLSQTSEDSL